MWIYGIVFISFFLLVWFTRKEKISPNVSSGARVWYRCVAGMSRKIMILRYFDKHTLSIALGVVVGGCILGTIVSIAEYRNSGIKIESIEKGGYEADSYQESLLVEEQGGKRHSMAVEIPGRSYTAKQVEAMFQEALSSMEEYILGANQTADYITTKMDLVTRIPDTPINAAWISDQPEVLNREGEPGGEIPAAGVLVKLTAELTYLSYSESYTRTVKVFPPLLAADEQLRRDIAAVIAEQNRDPEAAYVQLPETVAGRSISWFRPGTANGFMLFGMAILTAIIFLVGRYRRQIRQKEARKAQMMLDYPEILSKLILLLNAGMSMRKAFSKIAMDYKKQRTAAGNKSPIRYAYEEILGSFYEMERGISEPEAYQRLGIRCELPAYRTFSVLLVQHLKKGSEGLLKVLEKEAAIAFEERIRSARIRGELASTKLLLPMTGMLLIVFTVLLVPAFLSF